MGDTEHIPDATGVNNSGVELVAMNAGVEEDSGDESMSGAVQNQNETIANNIEEEPKDMEGMYDNGNNEENEEGEDDEEDDSYDAMGNERRSSRSSSEDSG